MDNCKEFYGLDAEYFKGKSCILTASEIAHQPKLWENLSGILLEKKTEIDSFIKKTGGIENVRVILTGAGSSAFIGETLVGLLTELSGVQSEAIHTTDLVSAPETVLFDKPTILVSFARSGNSPESVGAVEYARKSIKNLFEVAIVCAEDSALYNATMGAREGLALVMPKGSCDKAFAMTSSVTCMLLAGFALFNHNKIDIIAQNILLLSQNTSATALEMSNVAKKIAQKDFDRLIFIGSGSLKGTAHEASIKMLELTNGAVMTNFDSAPGFRHGPKTVIKDKTMTLHLISSNPFTAKYDLDLLNELYTEKKQNMVCAVYPDNINGVIAEDVIQVQNKCYSNFAPIFSIVQSLVFVQMVALHKSLALEITTDNPCPNGEVNRVVQGVTVYDYNR